jgi:hypothetical protein
MFCHDSTTIFYPTGPGRVYSVNFRTLAAMDGSDVEIKKSTDVSDLVEMLMTTLHPLFATEFPDEWPGQPDDFSDALEQWADWCDRDSARLDSLDEVKGRIERAA